VTKKWDPDEGMAVRKPLQSVAGDAGGEDRVAASATAGRIPSSITAVIDSDASRDHSNLNFFCLRPQVTRLSKRFSRASSALHQDSSRTIHLSRGMQVAKTG
jgi:hypothetical protein